MNSGTGVMYSFLIRVGLTNDKASIVLRLTIALFESELCEAFV